MKAHKKIITNKTYLKRRLEIMKSLIEEALYMLDERKREDCEDDNLIDNISDLQSAGYLTNDDGLFVKLDDGRKFIVTVKEA